MSRPVQARINLENIQYNFSTAVAHASGARVMAVVKANAYGHGAVAVARHLSRADAFGVASIEEAIELNDAGVAQPVVLLGGVFASEEWAVIGQRGFQAVIHNQAQLEGLLAHRTVAAGTGLVIWLKVDTGMHRLGFTEAEFIRARGRLLASGKVAKIVAMSHLACADEPGHSMTEGQLRRFKRAVSGHDGAKSIANSAALLTSPETHFDWVRPGIMLYGGNPLVEALPEHLNLLPAMTLTSRLVEVREVAAGETVGYGGQWRLPKRSRIGTVAIGYGDGYPRHARAGTPVLVRGKRAALVGRVSMDFITVDLGRIPDAQVNDEVELWGERLPVEIVAANAGSINYDLLTGVSSRVPRKYAGSG